ncbi:hypothetical protein ACFQLX_21720 [Streptomyces polyrhachis]|uniref:Helix-turn-helix domain-containing protein n=1 Tax=Streptomyces polyrhachis TaxID=1282885 RepID=A0ABW2GMP4_9ACTN
MPAPTGNPDFAVRSGVVHVRSQHHARACRYGDHFTPESALSPLAAGLGWRINALPDGTDICAKTLAKQCSNGQISIRRGLNELEAAGYLQRRPVQRADGRWVTRTTFYECPREAQDLPPATPGPTQAPSARVPAPRAAPAETAPVAAPAPVPAEAAPAPTVEQAPEARREQAMQQAPTWRADALPHAPRPRRHRKPTPLPSRFVGRPEICPSVRAGRSLPPRIRRRELQLARLDRGLLSEAADTENPETSEQPSGTPDEAPVAIDSPAGILINLRAHDPRLLLSAAAVRKLEPCVATWLEREVTPEQITHALTRGLPNPGTVIGNPAGFIDFRLNQHMPPLPPYRPTPKPAPTPPPRPTITPIPAPTMINCARCDRAFRGIEVEGQRPLCRKCTTETANPSRLPVVSSPPLPPEPTWRERVAAATTEDDTEDPAATADRE